MSTPAVVSICTFGLAPSVHFTHSSFWDSTPSHRQLNRMDIVCRKGRPRHRILWTQKIQNTINITYTEREIYRYIFEMIFPGTHLDSLMRAKLEPSGPHITWAMLTSCLLDQSGAPSRISETPSHTWYSLRSGTLERQKTELMLYKISHIY